MRKVGMVVVAGVILVGIAVFVVMGNNKPSSAPAASNTPSATITYSETGFLPDTLTVNSGDTIAVKNLAASNMKMESNPHPTHTDDPDLNLGTVGPNETRTFVANKKGVFGYHNHLIPTNTGKIVVE